jgi:hypothetical protein
VHGEWLHRRSRRADASVELRQAYELFNDMGTHAFSERAPWNGTCARSSASSGSDPADFHSPTTIWARFDESLTVGPGHSPGTAMAEAGAGVSLSDVMRVLIMTCAFFL